MGKVQFDFSGERYVVTGASSGMGREIAIELVSRGAIVLALGRDAVKLHELHQIEPTRMIDSICDVCDSQSLENTINDFVLKYGKLNGGVHAAGITELTPISNFDKKQSERIMDIGFWAGMELIKLITKAKNSMPKASIVLFSSIYACSHEKGMFAYVATKAAINHAIGSIAKEICKKGHRVNSVMPGWVNTPMIEKLNPWVNKEGFIERHPLGLGDAKDVSGMVLFLLSERSDWITGTNIPIDGGYFA